MIVVSMFVRLHSQLQFYFIRYDNQCLNVPDDQSDVYIIIEKGLTYVKLVCEVNRHTLWYESNESIEPSDAGHGERIEFGTHNTVGYNRTKGDANATITHINCSEGHLTSEIWIDISNSNYSKKTVTCGTDNLTILSMCTVSLYCNIVLQILLQLKSNCKYSLYSYYK